MLISPFEPVYQEVYQRMLDAIKKSTFLVRAPIILPASEIGNSFVLSDLTPGIEVQIIIDGKEYTRLIPDNATKTITIYLQPGKRHLVEARDDAGNRSLLLVACTYYATMLASLAQDWFENIRRDLEDHERQLTSRYSSRLLEHRLNFENLFPRTRAFRRQLVRMGVRSLVNEMTTERGVVDLTTAGTAQTPIVVPVASPKDVFSPNIHRLYNDAADFGGYEFHIWLFNMCVASWAAFVRLANNLDDNIMEILEVKESKVVVKVGGTTTEQHVFDFTSAACGLEGILAEFLDCMASIRAFIRTTIVSDYAIEAYGYFLDTEVENVLGGRWLDSGSALDSGVVLDTEDDIDPTAAGGDGWVGTGLSQRTDEAGVDTVVQSVATLATLSTVYDGPSVTPLQTQGLQVELDHAITTTATGDIVVVGMSTVTGYIQIINNTFDVADSIIIAGTPFTYNVDWVPGPLAEFTASEIANAITAAPPWPGIVAIASGLSPIIALYVAYVGPPPVVTLAVVDGATPNFVISGPQLA